MIEIAIGRHLKLMCKPVALKPLTYPKVDLDSVFPYPGRGKGGPADKVNSALGGINGQRSDVPLDPTHEFLEQRLTDLLFPFKMVLQRIYIARMGLIHLGELPLTFWTRPHGFSPFGHRV